MLNSKKIESYFKELQEKHACFSNPKLISILDFMFTSIENTKAKMFDLNTFSNTATVKNTKLMLDNYIVFVFLLENLQTLNPKELNLFIDQFRWDQDELFFYFFDFKVIKHYFFYCKDFDFSDKQTLLFND